jgi:hypothetical protein
MKILRDPLLHFIIIGGVLVALFRLTGSGGERSPDEIVVTAAQLASLKATFAQSWGREPSAEETENLVDEHVRDEVFYREAVAMGLDKDDAVIRRRLRQKMEFVAEVATEAEPTETELKAYVGEHAEKFRTEPTYFFTHVFFRQEGGAGPDPQKLETLLKALNDGAAQPEEQGDAFLPGFQFDGWTRSGVAQIFGEPFASALEDAPLDRWSGPVASVYGVHLIHVGAREPAKDPPFDDIRDVARREWLIEQREAANDALYEELKARYTVRIESAPGAAGEPNVAKAAR